MKGRLWVSGAMAALESAFCWQPRWLARQRVGTRGVTGRKTWRDLARPHDERLGSLGSGARLLHPLVEHGDCCAAPPVLLPDGQRQSEQADPADGCRASPASAATARLHDPDQANFRFSNGQQVKSSNFVRASTCEEQRAPVAASSFLDDVTSVRTRGLYALQVALEGRTDFLARITMPFFSAVLNTTPVASEVTSGPFHSAGPYYVREWNKRQSAEAVRNPFWKNSQQPYRSLRLPLNVDAINGGSSPTSRLSV